VPNAANGAATQMQAVLIEYGLAHDFNIDGYENWLPCHNHCNQSKGNRSPAFVPGNKAILDGLRGTARKAERVARSVSSNIAKDRVFKTVFSALEQQTITVRDLDDPARLQTARREPRELL
jgi:hypothetical protein